jgi:hypothetical protein
LHAKVSINIEAKLSVGPSAFGGPSPVGKRLGSALDKSETTVDAVQHAERMSLV